MPSNIKFGFLFLVRLGGTGGVRLGGSFGSSQALLVVWTILLEKSGGKKYILNEDSEDPKPAVNSHVIPARNTELAAKADAAKEKYRSKLNR